MTVVCDLLSLYILVLFVRAVLSWFPIRPDSGLVPVIRALDAVIDPAVRPLRRIIPPAGMLDLSYLVLFIIVIVIHSIVCGGSIF